MAWFLRTMPIAICDRCRRKMAHARLQPDGDKPGLRVCEDCRDVIDPYRLPAPPVERVAVTYARPDAALNAAEAGYVLGTGQGPTFTITTESAEDIEVEE